MSSVGGKGATIGQILQTVFPAGTQALNDQSLIEIAKTNATGAWQTIPVFPYDVFAFCAHLIQITGLMGYFEPNPRASDQFGVSKAGVVEPLKVVLSKDKREKCKDSSKAWRKGGKPDSYAISLWKVVHDASDSFIRIKEYQKVHADAMMSDPKDPMRPAPAWWQAVFELLIIADEACDGIGHYFTGLKETGKTVFEELASIRIRKSRATEDPITSGSYRMVRARTIL